MESRSVTGQTQLHVDSHRSGQQRWRGGVRSSNRKRICPDLRDLNSLNGFSAEQGGRIVLWKSNGGKNQDNMLHLQEDLSNAAVQLQPTPRKFSHLFSA